MFRMILKIFFFTCGKHTHTHMYIWKKTPKQWSCYYLEKIKTNFNFLLAVQSMLIDLDNSHPPFKTQLIATSFKMSSYTILLHSIF